MRAKRWTVSILSIILILSFVLAGCAKSGDESTNGGKAAKKSGKYTVINIGFPSSGADWADGPLAVAKVSGYLDEYLHPLGYEAKLTGFTGAAPAIHEALTSGDLDYAYYAGFAGVLAKSKGIDTKLLAVTSFGSVWQLAVSKDSKINSLKDLKGKKIAYQRGATPQMYVLKVLQEAGLSEKDAQLVNSTIPEGLSGLSTGAVDAAVVSYGQADELVKQGKAKVIHKGIDADKDKFYEPNVLIGRTDFVKKHADVNVAIIKAMLKAKDQIKKDPEKYYELSAKKSGRDLKQIKEVAVKDLNIGFPVNLDKRYLSSLKTIETFEKDNKIIQNDVDFKSWVDSSYLKKAQKEYEQK